MCQIAAKVPCSLSAVVRTLKRFSETNFIGDRGRSGRPRNTYLRGDSVESQFCISGNQSSAYVRRHTHEEFSPQCLKPTVKYWTKVMNNLRSNILERCLSNTTCSSSTLIGDVSDAKVIQESVDFFKEASNNDDEKTLVMDDANLRYNDLELAKNENHFLDGSAFINAVASNLIDAAVQCTPAECNGSLSSTTCSSSFTNVTEIDSFNNSEDPKDFGDFSLNSFKSYRQIDSKSSDLTSLSDSEGDVLSIEGSFVLKKHANKEIPLQSTSSSAIEQPSTSANSSIIDDTMVQDSILNDVNIPKTDEVVEKNIDVAVDQSFEEIQFEDSAEPLTVQNSDTVATGNPDLCFFL
ncbi:hypothetical protein TNCV_2960401 [Trichonephila clavipes]|nr:hypothetical protein TNCV_2960401 [Trichonephila clavipes]